MDASAYWYEVGRLFQRVSTSMDKHTVVAAQQVCTCGRIAVRRLPTFGLRCEVACEQWDLAVQAITQLTAQLRDVPPKGAAVGRARVRGERT
jgi:hypothetical protein